MDKLPCECAVWANDRLDLMVNIPAWQHHHKCPKGLENKTVYALETQEPNTQIFDDVKSVLDFANELLSTEMESGESITIKVREMTVNQLLALPEL